MPSRAGYAAHPGAHRPKPEDTSMIRVVASLLLTASLFIEIVGLDPLTRFPFINIVGPSRDPIFRSFVFIIHRLPEYGRGHTVFLSIACRSLGLRSRILNFAPNQWPKSTK